MRIIITVMILFCCAANAHADGPQLFKEFYYGQPRSEIAKIKGMVPCNDLQKGALCRDKQSFAGNDKWGQGFVFDDGKLSMVVIRTKWDETRITKTMYTIGRNGYAIAIMRSGRDSCDAVNVAHTKGVDAVEGAILDFESAALNGSDNLTYTLVPNDILKRCGKISATYSELVKCAPDDMRVVEVELLGKTMFVRFVAPKALLARMQHLASGQKESF